MTMSVISTPRNLYDRHRTSYPDISDTCEWGQDSKRQLKNTVEELRSVIVLLKRPDFNPAEIDDDLHKRIARAVH